MSKRPNKWSRADVRVRVRRGVVRIEVEQARIRLIVVVAAHIEHAPAGVRVQVENKAPGAMRRQPLPSIITAAENYGEKREKITHTVILKIYKLGASPPDPLLLRLHLLTEVGAGRKPRGLRPPVPR